MTTDSDLSWYRRHETERCECGHERREHPRQPFTVPGTPGCTGVVDYGGDCACPRFRFAHELDPAPGPLDPEEVYLASLEGLEDETPEDRAMILSVAQRRYWMATRPTRATGPSPNDDWFSIYKTSHQMADAYARSDMSDIVVEAIRKVGGDLARDLEPDVRAWEAEIAADRELFIAQMLREGIE